MFTNKTFPQAVTTAGHNKPNRDFTAAKGYRRNLQLLPTYSNRSQLALSHLTFKHSGKFQACEGGGKTFWSPEMFQLSPLCVLPRGRASNLNAEVKTSARSQEDSSLCHLPSRSASRPALLLAKREGGGERKIKKQQILMRCCTEE